MDQKDILANLRRLIGNPDPNRVSARDLADYIASASDWIAVELKLFFSIETFMLGLTANEQEIALPEDLAWILFVEWSGTRLEPSSHFQRDRTGINYRTATAGDPSSFAVIGRNLILQAPVSSTAYATDANLTLRYVSTAPQMTTSGIRGLSNVAARLMLARAAWEYWGAHPELEGADARIAFAEKQMASLLLSAKASADRPILDETSGWYPMISRTGAAR